ncbi:hypothetical protein FOC56_07830 [Staphylococcus hominis]|uniref:hypothetical protein n=1 Tax=Staphylococcus hominis TaxID=1290 RepID=UPI001588C28E|nr:hypothetical protein [Staphylococcus hominis]QKW67592.1 hypothetical protein FOC56_07830 [Staphylococcus hominis]
MKDKDYKRAWLELKRKLLEEYPSLHDLHWPEGKYYSDYDNGRLEKLENVLMKMDELDGTNDFKNLLSDLEEQ